VLLAMMLVVTAVAAATLVVAQHYVASGVRAGFEREFQGEVAALRAAHDVRDAALAERCRALARRPRIHAALEDDAQDLLYPSARDEMHDAMEGWDAESREPGAYALKALYYRFLDAGGRVIRPSDANEAGELDAAGEARLGLRVLPVRPETGYIARGAAGQARTDEVVAMPIVSTENGEVISAIVVGFSAGAPAGAVAGSGVEAGVWIGGGLAPQPAPRPALDGLADRIGRAVASGSPDGSLEASCLGVPYIVFFKRLNPGSLYPPAYEVLAFSLAASRERQEWLLWQILGAGALLMAAAYGASHLVALRLSRPVERLAEDSAVNLDQRHRAEAALELTSQELQRAARFSADASHQLKTPVTVLRAGLEELLAGEQVSPQAREEVSALVHQTFRLASVIEDLLLLSRMDAGRLQIQFGRVDLVPLLEAWVDDMGAIPDGPRPEVDCELPPALWIEGEKRFVSLILQNLLENARKYNRPGGRVRIAARADGAWAVLAIGNTGNPIPEASRAHIFERFHRAAMAENVPGHGIGLNLARELARLHGGDLRLARSGDDWTEFEVRFRAAGAPPGEGGGP
jgi:signal transduction histidine kinase